MIAGGLLLSLLAHATTPSPPPVVRTDGGLIQGEQTADGRSLFRGIPFAAPPIGPLRWQAPAPAAHWQGIRDATHSTPACPQIDYGWNHDAAARQSEDCLYLEIGTPSLRPPKPLPVMVWIHGGGNRAGGGAGTISSPLVQRGVVLVSLQYRLGGLGFLSHPALGARSGNYGLMDQQAALRWVRRNIARFGGDPANVTIFGESAGAQDVGLQLLSPGARGLFAKAIEESGSPGFGTPPRTLAENERLGELIVAKAGAGPHPDAAELRRLPADALVKASETTDVPDLDDDSFIWLQAVIDGAVITRPPAETLARGAGARVPLIIGNNARELTLYGQPRRAIERAFGNNTPQALASYGLGVPPRSIDDPRLGDLGLQLSNDINFRCPALSVARDLARHGLPVWHYQFDVPGPDGADVRHGSEIRFVLGEPGADRHAITPLAAYWVNFARTGNPNSAGLPHWPRYGVTDAFSILFEADGSHVAQHLRSKVCQLRQAP